MWGAKAQLTPAEVVQVVTSTYRSGQQTLAHLEEVKSKFRTVVVRLELIKGGATAPHSIVNICGTFPITFKGSKLLCRPSVTYSTPLHVRVLPDYPVSAPVVFLVPTPDMAIVRQHKNVDEQGRCYLPYLTSWNPASSSLAGLVTVMSEVFSEVPPLYSKPKPLPGMPPQNEAVVRPSYQAPLPAAAMPAVMVVDPRTGQPVALQGNPPPAVVPAGGNSNVAKVVEDPDLAVDPKMCIVCMERPKEAMTTPCNHVACCTQCANYMQNHKQPCPVCRGAIGSVIRVYVV